jgi:hypothetical protein
MKILNFCFFRESASSDGRIDSNLTLLWTLFHVCGGIFLFFQEYSLLPVRNIILFLSGIFSAFFQVFLSFLSVIFSTNFFMNILIVLSVIFSTFSPGYSPLFSEIFSTFFSQENFPFFSGILFAFLATQPTVPSFRLGFFTLVCYLLETSSFGWNS